MKTRNCIFIFILFLAGCQAPAELGGASQRVDPREYPRDVRTSGLSRGDYAPEFSVIGIDGKTYTLSDFSGSPLLLEFFATWCPYCDKDFRALGTVYAEYPEVTILAIDLDLKEDSDTIRHYKYGYSGIERVVFSLGNEKILRDYSIRLTTTKYAIGRDGRILYAGSGAFSAEQWKILLEEMRKG